MRIVFQYSIRARQTEEKKCMQHGALKLKRILDGMFQRLRSLTTTATAAAATVTIKNDKRHASPSNIISNMNYAPSAVCVSTVEFFHSLQHISKLKMHFHIG